MGDFVTYCRPNIFLFFSFFCIVVTDMQNMSEPLFSRVYHIHPLGRSGALRHSPLLELDKTRDHVTQLTILFLSGKISFHHTRKNELENREASPNEKCDHATCWVRVPARRMITSFFFFIWQYLTLLFLTNICTS